MRVGDQIGRVRVREPWRAAIGHGGQEIPPSGNRGSASAKRLVARVRSERHACMVKASPRDIDEAFPKPACEISQPVHPPPRHDPESPEHRAGERRYEVMPARWAISAAWVRSLTPSFSKMALT